MNDFYCGEVLTGRTSVQMRFENETVLAFEHTRPAYSAAHVVVIPRAHIPDLLEVDDIALLALVDVVRRETRRALAEHGACRVVTNLGRYQDSPHLHWHLVSGDRIR